MSPCNLAVNVNHMMQVFFDGVLHHMEQIAERRPGGPSLRVLFPFLDPGNFLEKLHDETRMYGRSKGIRFGIYLAP